MAHDVRGDPVPEATAGPCAALKERQAPAVDARPQQGQQRRQEGEGVEDGKAHHGSAGQTHRREIGARVEEQPGQADGDGDAGEGDGAPGSRHTVRQRVDHAEAAQQLFAEAVDDEQGVVDSDPQADDRDDVQRIGRHVRHSREQVDDRQPTQDGAEADAERQQRGHHCAEHQQQEQQRQRQRHLFGPLQVVGEVAVEVGADGEAVARLHRQLVGVDK